MSHSVFLRQSLSQGFSLPEDRVSWLMDVWEVIQTLDDYADEDEVSRDALDLLIWRVLVSMPGNPWFTKHSSTLLPIMASSTLKWQASNKAEKDGEANAKSFVWRAGYYDLILMAILLVHGQEAAAKVSHLVMNLYGESFEEYMNEFRGVKNA